MTEGVAVAERKIVYDFYAIRNDYFLKTRAIGEGARTKLLNTRWNFDLLQAGTITERIHKNVLHVLG